MLGIQFCKHSYILNLIGQVVPGKKVKKNNRLTTMVNDKNKNSGQSNHEPLG